MLKVTTISKSLLLSAIYLQTFSSSLSLNDRCPELSQIKSAYQVDSNEQYITCSRIQEYDRLTARVNELTAHKKKVNLLINKQGNNASFDHGLNIALPSRLVFYGKYGQIYHGSASGLQAIYVHEYAHAIFSNRLKVFSELTNFITQSEEISKLSLKYLMDSTSQLKDQIKALSDEREEFRYYKFNRVISTHNKLYADVVAAFLNKDKYSISSALYYDEMSDMSYSRTQARSFSYPYELSSSVLSDVHTLFSPTRNFIGDNMWPSDEEEKKLYLEIITQAILENIENYLSNDKTTITPTKANQELQKRLEQKLEEYRELL